MRQANTRIRRRGLAAFAAIALAYARGRRARRVRGGLQHEPAEPLPRVPARPGPLHRLRGGRSQRAALPHRHQRPRPDRGRVPQTRKRVRLRAGRAREDHQLRHPGREGNPSCRHQQPWPRSSAATARTPRSSTTRPGRVDSCSTTERSSGSTSPARSEPGLTASTIAVRSWADTSMTEETHTASSGRKDGSPPSTSPPRQLLASQNAPRTDPADLANAGYVMKNATDAKPLPDSTSPAVTRSDPQSTHHRRRTRPPRRNGTPNGRHPRGERSAGTRTSPRRSSNVRRIDQQRDRSKDMDHA